MTKLRSMHHKQPKEYWKFLNRLKNKNNFEQPNITEFYQYFKNINMAGYEESEDTDIPFIDPNESNEYLNSPISAQEIDLCIRKLKTSKSSGLDNIINEYLKNTSYVFIYERLFNIILDTGIIPASWVEGIIIPIFKNKGSSTDPDNYRPITLLSCFGKLFTAVLNSRLNNYLEEFEILKENQAGFRKAYSTLDHIFTLRCLTELFKYQKKKLFCSFIDFSKAFDSVWRLGLWQKLINSKVNGKFFRVIQNLYLNIKSCVSQENELSSFFGSYCGVRQGENLSPDLFSLFLNDLESFLVEKQNNGITVENHTEDISIFLKIIVLLYADDTVILASDPDSFQKCLDDFNDYCNDWKLKINVNKSKVIIFGCRNNNAFSFRIGDQNLEIIDSYKYLGIYLTKNGSFLNARKHLAEQAHKALHLLYTRINNLALPIDLQLKLFDYTVLPIMTYASEIWGFENVQILERTHAAFLRRITKTKKSTPHYMLYAELGRYPIEIIIKVRMVGFWNRLGTSKQTKLSALLYNVLHNTPGLKCKWINYVKQIFIDTGKFNIWLSPDPSHYNNLNSCIKRILIDQNLQKWNASLENSSKGINYKLFKETIELERYFLTLPPKQYLTLVKFRTSNHRFPVETCRWEGIPLADRKCNLCDKNDIADEVHYLLICPFFAEHRSNYIDRYFYRRPNILKFKELLCINSVVKLKKLCKFIDILFKYFDNRP